LTPINRLDVGPIFSMLTENSKPQNRCQYDVVKTRVHASRVASDKKEQKAHLDLFGCQVDRDRCIHGLRKVRMNSALGRKSGDG
jgi:hypothetical protein